MTEKPDRVRELGENTSPRFTAHRAISDADIVRPSNVAGEAPQPFCSSADSAPDAAEDHPYSSYEDKAGYLHTSTATATSPTLGAW